MLVWKVSIDVFLRIYFLQSAHSRLDIIMTSSHVEDSAQVIANLVQLYYKQQKQLWKSGRYYEGAIFFFITCGKTRDT